jgi:hypothetical protein
MSTGVSEFWRVLIHWLANLRAHCETRNRAALAPSRVADVLAPAFTSQRQDGPPPDCAGAVDPDPAHDHREPILGSAADSGRTDEAWVQSFCQNGREVYASKPSRDTCASSKRSSWKDHCNTGAWRSRSCLSAGRLDVLHQILAPYRPPRRSRGVRLPRSQTRARISV